MTARDLALDRMLALEDSGGDYQMYDVSPDGERLLVVQFVNSLVNLSIGTNSPDPDLGLVVAQNWTSTIEKQGR